MLYVTGEGKGIRGWGPHAWNAVKINGRWIHFDFTFSMNSFDLPCTRTVIEEKRFSKTHRWNETECSCRSMDSKWKSIYSNNIKGLKIEVEDNICRIDGAEVKFSSKLLIRDGNLILVDIASIVRLLGGGMELIPDTGLSNSCVCNKRIELKNALKHFHDGYFDQSVLALIWKTEWISEYELRMTI